VCVCREVLEAFRADVADNNAKYDELKEKLAAAQAEKEEELANIAELRRRLDKKKGGMKAQVERMKRASVAFSSWRIVYS
jgi:predicted nuclease with TOPRIM domain